MPYKISVNSNGTKIDAKSDLLIELGDADFNRILKNLHDLNNKTPLKKVEYLRIGHSSDMEYTMESQNGRTWTQIISNPFTDIDPFMTFDVSTAWKLSEITIQREVRRAFIELSRRCQMDSFKAMF